MLLLLLPARPRQHPRLPGVDGADLARLAAASVAEVFFVWSSDGANIDDSGRTAPALLRQRGNIALALLPEEALSWQLIRVPRAPAARLQTALLGLVEEHLLDDGEHCHFALSPGARGGASAWLAVTDRDWLAGQLAALQAAGLQIDRVVPLMAPPEPVAGELPADAAAPGGAAMPVHLHVQTGAELADADLPTGGGSSEDELVVSVASADGVACWPAAGSLARRLLPDPMPLACRITASSAAAAAAEVWLAGPRGHADLRITMLSRAERMVEAAASAWNLRQFNLSAPNRGGTALRAAWQNWCSPAWRAVRYGLVGLVLVQLIGLNAWAWQQRSALSERRAAMVQLLRSSHPQVRAVLDAPLQMQRETDTLRAAAGRAGDSDLEVLMMAVASAWPANTPSVSLAFDAGRLTLASPDLRAAAADAIAARLRPAGWQVEASEGSVAISKARQAR
jgi:general secretion pathway protein L